MLCVTFAQGGAVSNVRGTVQNIQGNVSNYGGVVGNAYGQVSILDMENGVREAGRGRAWVESVLSTPERKSRRIRLCRRKR
jgi:hypothetical protein